MLSIMIKQGIINSGKPIIYTYYTNNTNKNTVDLILKDQIFKQLKPA